MKIVVLGKVNKTAEAVERVAKDTYHYVNNVNEAIKAVKENKAEMLVIENNNKADRPLSELIVEMNRMPQDVKVIVLSPSRHYFLVTNNTLETSINYHIPEKPPSKEKKKRKT